MFGPGGLRTESMLPLALQRKSLSDPTPRVSCWILGPVNPHLIHLAVLYCNGSSWFTGHGHTLLYLDRERVSKYIAVEPNEGMHPEIRKAASAAGYDELKDEFLILSCGAEHVDQITRATGGENKVDTIVSVLTLCSIPEPQQAISAMVNRLLKPGGQFLLYEHVRSPRTDVSFWQSVWTPVWSIFFDGCKLDRPTDLWVEKLGGWKESIIWGKEGESQERLFIHRLGRFVKE
jgi:SAM-dependent methyltransferase